MSQGQKVMAEIKLIRAALTKQGYSLQKLPRQAVWMIRFDQHQAYRLTYQPAPVSTWVVHPFNDKAAHLCGVIDRALNQIPSTDVGEITTKYQQQLHPWCVIQLLPQMQRRTIARFRRRNDAEAHIRVLRQLTSGNQYTIVFDPVLDPVFLSDTGVPAAL